MPGDSVQVLSTATLMADGLLPSVNVVRLLAILLICLPSLLFAHPGIGIVRDARGNIFYTDLTHVWKLTPDGEKSIAVRDVHTHELYMDANGDLHGEHLWYTGEATDNWMHYDWRLTAAGELIKGPEIEGLEYTSIFTRDSSGRMYWVQRGDTARFFRKETDGATTLLAEVPLANIRWQFCQKNGTYWFVNDNDLYRITADQELGLVAKDLDGEKKEQTDPNHSIMGIWDDAQGRIHVAVSSERKVVRIEPSGATTIVWKTALPWSPSGGLWDEDGNLWLLEYDPVNRVRVSKIDAARLGTSKGELPWLLIAAVALLLAVAAVLVWKRAGRAITRIRQSARVLPQSSSVR